MRPNKRFSLYLFAAALAFLIFFAIILRVSPARAQEQSQVRFEDGTAIPVDSEGGIVSDTTEYTGDVHWVPEIVKTDEQAQQGDSGGMQILKGVVKVVALANPQTAPMVISGEAMKYGSKFMQGKSGELVRNMSGWVVNGISSYFLGTEIIGTEWILNLVIPKMEGYIDIEGGREVIPLNAETGEQRVNDISFIRRNHATVRALSFWLIVLLLMAGGVKVMGSSLSGMGSAQAKALIPRAAFALFGGYFGLWICQRFLDINYAMCSDVIGANSIYRAAPVKGFYEAILTQSSADSATVVLVGGLVLLFGLCILYVVYHIRFAAIVILAVLSPVAFACCLLEETEYITIAWAKVFSAIVFMQFIHSVIIKVFESSLFAGMDALSSVLMSICLMYLMFKIPSALLQSSLANSGSSFLSKTRQVATTAMVFAR